MKITIPLSPPVNMADVLLKICMGLALFALGLIGIVALVILALGIGLLLLVIIGFGVANGGLDDFCAIFLVILRRLRPLGGVI
jgi:hypothetical protein